MIIGHQKIREKLSRSVEKNAFVQTYLFVGPESVGKFEVAKEYALKLIGSHDDSSTGKEESQTKQNNRQDVDLFVLEPEHVAEKGVVKEKDIKVERAREAAHFLASFPYAGHKKVLIIRDAHRLTEAAQNALLKTLEEPPSYAVIILVTHELGRILPTLLSRCQQISFQLLSSQEMSEGVVLYPALTSSLSSNTFLLNLGRPGLIVQSSKQEVECTAQLALLERLMTLSSKPLRERLVVSEACGANVPQTMQLLMWWVGGLHARLPAASSDESVMQMRSIEKIERLRSDLNRFPSSSRLVLDTFFLHW